jgi:DNA-binding NtrC family response regulator
VEDEPELRNLVQGYLEHRGLRCCAVGDAEAAIRSLARTRFDLVVSDVHLPGASGLDLLASIRRDLPKMPVLLISGAKDPRISAAARRLDAKFLEKPFELPNLLEAVLDALATEP